MRATLCGLGLATLMVSGAVTPAMAGDGFVALDGYGFAGNAVAGSYVGAPLTRFPRPSEIVPPAWGYGTYGVPTMTGIPPTPVAPPTITVINPDPVARPMERTRTKGSEAHWAAGRPDARESSGIRVISVTVPRR